MMEWLGKAAKWVGSLVGIGSDAASIWSSAKGVEAGEKAIQGQADINAANIQQAKDQMAFQERMSNTAHQREVVDLRAAGLNPILSANSGASSPGGSIATLVNPYKDMAETWSNSAKNVSQTSVNSATRAEKMSNIAFNSASAKKMNADANLSTVQAQNKMLERGIINANTLIANSTAEQAAAQAAVAKRSAEFDLSKTGRWIGNARKGISALGSLVGGATGTARDLIRYNIGDN